MIRIYCSKADATLQETETLTAGMVNTPVVQFTFSTDWDGLGKSAIVRAGTVIKEVVVSNNQIVVPSECLAKAGVNLIIGVWGGNFTTELPTVWCACGEIQDATNPNSALNHEEATASNVAQMLAAAERAEAALDQIENANWDDVAQKVGVEKVNKPTSNPNGTEGQILKTNGDGSTLWVDPPDIFDEEIDAAIGNWLDEHPEATTTVQDESITKAKLSTEVKEAYKGRDHRPFRYIFISDMHLWQWKYYDIEPGIRLQKMVDDLNYEIETTHIDGVFVLGDPTTDYIGTSPYGRPSKEKSEMRAFMNYFVPQIKTNVYVFPGNHEIHSNEEWKELTGVDRQATFIDHDKNVAIIYLDTYRPGENGNDSDNYRSTAVYTPVDTDYLESQLALCEGMMVVVCAHYLQNNNAGADESEAFKNIIKNHDNVLCLMAGHTHSSRVIPLGEDYGGKYLLETGNYSYEGAYNDNYPFMCGFRDLTLTQEGIVSNYIIPAYTNVTVRGESVSADYSTQDSITLQSQYVSYKTTVGYTTDDEKRITNFDGYRLFGAIQIPPNTDLNTLKDPGTYICATGTVAQTLSNMPTFPIALSYGFKLIVERASGEMGWWNMYGQIRQTIIPLQVSQGYSTRALFIDSWSGWKSYFPGTTTAWEDISSYLNTDIWTQRSDKSLQARVVNGIVYFAGHVYLTGEASGDVTVFNALPTTYRPADQVSLGFISHMTFRPFFIWINSGGVIKCRTNDYSAQTQYDAIDLSCLNGHVFVG